MDPLYFWLAPEGEPATKDGRLIVGTSVQLAALLPAWRVRMVRGSDREGMQADRYLPVEEWAGRHLRWDAEIESWRPV